MPRIDFICKDCGAHFGEYVRFADRDKLKCPECNGMNLKQDFSGKWNGGTVKSSGSWSGSDSSSGGSSSGFT